MNNLRTVENNNVEQLSLLFEDDGKEKIKEFYSSEDLKKMIIAGYHFEKDYILYFIDQEKNIWETWHLTSDIALLNENMVYYKEDFSYPFLKKFSSHNEVMKFYNSELKKIMEVYKKNEEPYEKGDNIQVIRNEDIRFSDMYLYDEENMKYGQNEYVERRNKYNKVNWI